MKESTLLSLLDDALVRHAKSVTLRGDDNCCTYQEVLDVSRVCSNALLDWGINRGDRVVTLAGNSVWSAVILMAVLRAGAVEVAIEPSEPKARISAIVQEIKPALIIAADPDSKRRLAGEGIRPDAIMSIGDSLMESKATSHERAREEVLDADEALIQYTSGSTGKPKGIIHTHGAFASILTRASYLGQLKGMRLLLGIPLAHAYGKTCLIEYILGGSHIVIERGFLLPTQITQSAKEHHVSAIEGPPSLYEMALKDDAFRAATLPDMSYIAMNSAKPREALLLELRKRFPEATIVVRYGISEIAGPLCRLVWRGDEDVPLGSCGIPEPYIRLEIRDAQGRAARSGEQGEVFVRSPGIMKGIANSRRSYDRDEYRTGDIGYFDERGYLYLVGRRDHMIKSAGFRIVPREIEDVIRAVPGVSDCIVAGVPDSELYQRIVAWVEPEENQQLRELETAIIISCRSTLEHFKIPHLMVFKRPLPRSALGKIRLDALIADASGSTSDLPKREG